MAFGDILRIAFNNIIQIASEDIPVLSNTEIWREVRDLFFSGILLHLQKNELFDFLIRLAPLFVRRDCQDKSLMTQMFYTVRLERAVYYPSPTNLFMKERFYGIIRTRDERERRRSQVYDDFTKIFSVPYKDAQVYDERGDSVTYTALAGDINLLKVLLMFGATVIQPPKENSHWRYCEIIVQKLFSNVPTPSIRLALRLNFSQKSKRRLYFVLLCLEVLYRLKSPSTDSYDYIGSLQHLFKAIPEPLVTTKEISHYLVKLLRGLQKGEQIDTVANEFGNFFPESIQLPGPRSLKHLCRFQVRENLRTAFPFRLPQAIGSLPLPTELKNYILLDIV